MKACAPAARHPVSLIAVVGFALLSVAGRAEQPAYFPPRGEWERRQPADAGMDPVVLQRAVDFSVANETKATRDMAKFLEQVFAPHEPMWKLLGPTQPRGNLTGVVVRHGYVVASWGDPGRVDMTHSVTKTFLTTVVGLAWQRGMIRSLDDPARDYLPTPELFASEHDAGITWDDLLRQTSDWSGTLWGMPDWADRPVGIQPSDYPNRPMHRPGTFYKYNDVRVNLLSLVALNVWRRPLPQVLREEVMDPIGASGTWRWLGYGNSWVVIDGENMQSVSGGGHLGGGMFVDAWDMARFGYLFLRGGRWGDRQIVSDKWIALARTPGPANADYGFANWFLNTGRRTMPAAPESSVTFRGNGPNVIYIDWDHDLVIVIRWIDEKKLNEFVGQVLGAIRD